MNSYFENLVSRGNFILITGCVDFKIVRVFFFFLVDPLHERTRSAVESSGVCEKTGNETRTMRPFSLRIHTLSSLHVTSWHF